MKNIVAYISVIVKQFLYFGRAYFFRVIRPNCALELLSRLNSYSMYPVSYWKRHCIDSSQTFGQLLDIRILSRDQMTM